MTTEKTSAPPRSSWFRDGPTLPEALFLLALAAFQAVGSHFAAEEQIERDAPDPVAFALLIAGPLVLMARRRRPVAVLVIVLGITLAYLSLGYAYGPIFFSLIVAIYTTVVEGHRRAAWLAAGGLLVGHLVLENVAGRDSPLTFQEVLAAVAWMLVILVVSEIARIRKERRLEAARILEEEERRRASDERLQIARELHDVLAHSISLINVQAGVALHLMDEQPEQARTALASIKQASKDALQEVRSTLGALRGVEEHAPRGPSPSLRRLDDLIQTAGATGLDVSARTTGEPRALPAAVDAAAFRIIQESLTNVTRHAGSAATATVTVAYGTHDVTVEIEDDGNADKDMYAKWAQGVPPARGNQDAGHGIVGMRERAGALGGDLEAGPRPGGGFRVRARLPLDGEG